MGRMVQVTRKSEKVSYAKKGNFYVGYYRVVFELTRASLCYVRGDAFGVIGRFRMGKRKVRENYREERNGFSGTLVLSGRTSKRTTRQSAMEAVEWQRKELPNAHGEIPANKEEV